MEPITAASDCKVEVCENGKRGFDDARRAARTSYAQGITRSVQFRKKQLKNLLSMYTHHADEMALALNKDLGRSAFEATFFEIEILKNDVINVLAHIKEWTKPQNADKRLMDFFARPQIYRDAYGVVLIIGAWNYPFQSSLLPLASAIAAGNCVIINPHSVTKHAVNFLRGHLHEYLDSTCYMLCEEDFRSPMNITSELDIDYLFFTGSLSVAKQLHALCSKSLTPGTFVVGSQNPVYIDKTADITLTARRVMWGKCVNAGQTCIAPGYVLCSRDVMSAFIREVPKVMAEFYGDIRTSPDYGRIVSEENFDRLVSFLQGRNIAYGGGHDRSSLYLQPTVLADVTPNFALLYDEIYGPILPCVVIEDLQEAIAFLRARQKPLAQYVFSKDNQVVEKLIAQTSAGGVTVNDVLMHFATDSLPFGGVGGSGFGSYHGKYSFETFSHEKAVLKKSQNTLIEKVEGIRYPPSSDSKLFIMKHFMRKRRTISISTGWIKMLLVFLLGMLVCYIITTA